MIDDAAYRRFTSLGRQLVDSGDLTPQGLRMLDAVAIEESGPGPSGAVGTRRALRLAGVDLARALERKQCDIAPPYLFPDVVDEPFPTLLATTVGEVLYDCWSAAFREARKTVARYFADLERDG